MSLSNRLNRQNTPDQRSTQTAPAASTSTPASHPTISSQDETKNFIDATKRRTPRQLAELRRQIRPRLLAAPNEADEWTRNDPERQAVISERLKIYLQRANISLSPPEFDLLRAGLLDDLLGCGPIEELISDKTVSEIMVNGPETIFVERKGKLTESDIAFDDNEHVNWVGQRIVRRLGRSFNRDNPMTDARLPDGSRVHLIMPPSAIQGTTITIRKFPEKVLTIDDLVSWGSLTQEVADFLEACVVARLNIVVSGGTGSGKTTLLNVLSGFIPTTERIVTIEDAAELQLRQRHVVRLETVPPIPGTEDSGQLTIRDLVKGSMRMRPDRIVVGEVRDGAAIDMLQAMNTGQDGALTTVHANSPRDAMGRLETLSLMSGMELPLVVIRRQIASAINVVVQQARLKDGSRKITQISEIQGLEGDKITIQDLFTYKTDDHTGQGPSHNGGGRLQPAGFRPNFMDRLERAGFKLGANVFGSIAQKPAQV